MFNGYFEFGGREVGNAARAYAYATSLAPAMGVSDPLKTDDLTALLTPVPYTNPEDDTAPWFDLDDPDTARFYGFYPLEMRGLTSSTLEASVTEGITDGGFIGRARQSTREVLIRGLLYAADEMAMNAGLTWLRETLSEPVANCSMHGAMCGANDFAFLAARPDGTFDAMSGALRYRRHLHAVALTSPVRILEARQVGPKDSPCGFMARVEFAITAENPEILHEPRPARLTPVAGPVAVLEPATEVVNRAIHPSFEDFTTFTTLHTNLVSQPSGEGSVDEWEVNISPGFSVDATIGSIDPPAGAPFGRSYIQMRFNAAPSGTVVPVGLRYSVSVEEGKRYSFGVRTIISTITQRLRVAIEWRTDTTQISTEFLPEWVGLANQPRLNTQVENLLAPPNATRAWIRVQSASAGPGATRWTAGSALWLDGVMAVEGQRLPPYFDGDTEDFEDFRYTWAGSANDSNSRMQAPLALGMIPAEDAFGGGAGFAYRTQRESLFGESAGRYEWRDNQALPLPSYFGMGGDLADLAAVSPGLLYVGSIHAKFSRDVLATVELAWFDGAGNELSVDQSLTFGVIGNNWYRFAIDGEAPASSAYAAVRIQVTTDSTIARVPRRMFRAGEFVLIDGAMVTQGPELYSYFDGATLTDGIFDYEWDGDADSSTSRRVAFDPTVDDLVDPLLPPIMEPPTPPAIPDIALPADTEWNRLSSFIPDNQVFRWAEVYPIIRIWSGTEAVRRVRVGLIPDPYSGTGDPQYIADIPSGFVISYLPPDAVMTVDASIRRAWVQIGGGPPRNASSLLFGLDGGPIEWPKLEGGLGYVLLVDTPDGEGLAEPLDATLVRKE